VFNTFTANYSYDPGGDKYFSVYQIKDVDGTTNPGGVLSTFWDVCRAAYLVYKTIKEFRIDLSFFNDRSRWYNEGEDGVGLGVDGSAYHFMENAVFWLTRQKRNVEYNLPMTTDHITAELCAPVQFRDPIYTNSVVETDYLGGSIHTIEYDIKNDEIIIGAMLDPNDTIDEDFGDIIETGSQTDTITESGSRTNTYTENGNT
jgi:hypothetical protein